MRSDIEIAQAATMNPITDVASRLGIPDDALDQYGRYKAKVSLDYVDSLTDRPDGKLILVTAISPTPAGEGKTTTTVGLGDALNHIGKRAMVCLREPSLGPVFGLKGGAAGGGAFSAALICSFIAFLPRFNTCCGNEAATPGPDTVSVDAVRLNARCAVTAGPRSRAGFFAGAPAFFAAFFFMAFFFADFLAEIGRAHV